jgi:hypothetical protein
LINKDLFEFLVLLAVKWFRCETNIDIVQAEIHEMEADFQNIQTNATRVESISLITTVTNCLNLFDFTHDYFTSD